MITQKPHGHLSGYLSPENTSCCEKSWMGQQCLIHKCFLAPKKWVIENVKCCCCHIYEEESKLLGAVKTFIFQWQPDSSGQKIPIRKEPNERGTEPNLRQMCHKVFSFSNQYFKSHLMYPYNWEQGFQVNTRSDRILVKNNL